MTSEHLLCTGPFEPCHNTCFCGARLGSMALSLLGILCSLRLGTDKSLSHLSQLY